MYYTKVTMQFFLMHFDGCFFGRFFLGRRLTFSFEAEATRIEDVLKILDVQNVFLMFRRYSLMPNYVGSCMIF